MVNMFGTKSARGRMKMRKSNPLPKKSLGDKASGVPVQDGAEPVGNRPKPASVGSPVGTSGKVKKLHPRIRAKKRKASTSTETGNPGKFWKPFGM